MSLTTSADRGQTAAPELAQQLITRAHYAEGGRRLRLAVICDQSAIQGFRHTRRIADLLLVRYALDGSLFFLARGGHCGSVWVKPRVRPINAESLPRAQARSVMYARPSGALATALASTSALQVGRRRSRAMPPTARRGQTARRRPRSSLRGSTRVDRILARTSCRTPVAGTAPALAAG